MPDGALSLQIPGTEPGTDTSKPAGGDVQQKSDGTSTIVPQVDTKKQRPADPNRPAWLPEKFKTAEEFAASYTELEKKLGGQKPADQQTPAPVDTKLADADMAKLNDEYSKNGKLSDETYRSLAGKGLSKEMVNNYIDGQKAIASQKIAALGEHVGGSEALTTLIGWAGETLTDAEIASANKILSSGDVDAAKVVLDGLKSRYVAANGSEPSLVQGRGTSRAGDIKPFRSNAEVTKAMSDPRYKTDPAYQADVYARLDISKL